MSPERPGGGDGGSDRPGDTPVGRGEDPVDVDAAWADIVARWGEPAADRGTSRPDDPRGREPGDGADGTAEEPVPDDLPPGEPPAPGTGTPPGRRVLRGRAEEGRPVEEDRGSSDEEPPAGRGSPAGWTDADEQAPPAWRGGRAPDRDGPVPDDDHYVPPEPPRSPPASTLTRLAWAGVVAGPALLLLCALLWRDAPSLVVAAAVAAFVVGFGVLVARLPRSRDDDDGAVV